MAESVKNKIKNFSAIQTVGEGNLRKDGRMPGGVFGGIGRRGGEGHRRGSFSSLGRAEGQTRALTDLGEGCGIGSLGEKKRQESVTGGGHGRVDGPGCGGGDGSWPGFFCTLVH